MTFMETEELWSLQTDFYKIQEILTYSFTCGMVHSQIPISKYVYSRIHTLLLEHDITEQDDAVTIHVKTGKQINEIDKHEWINGFLLANGRMKDDTTVVSVVNDTLIENLDEMKIPYTIEQEGIHISMNEAPTIILIRRLLMEK